MPGLRQVQSFDDAAGRISRTTARVEQEDCGRPAKACEMAVLGGHLHAMCQPLTAMQCRLEIGLMLGTVDGYEESVTDSLRECERLIASVQQMREVIGRALDTP